MEISCNEDRMTDLIKSLLCLDNKSSYHCHTKTENFTINFKGNCYNVQKSILKWLSLPDRKQNMEMRGGKL